MSFSEWRKVKIKDVTTKIGSGATPRGGSSVYQESGTAFVRSQNIYNNYFDYSGLVYIDDTAASKLKGVTVYPNDVLLNITGDSVARCTIVPQQVLPARVNQHVCIIRADETELDYRFLKYALVNPTMQELMLSYAQTGGTRAALTKVMVEEFEINLPPVEEQKAIANILSSLDEKIELNNQMNKTLEEMAQALFKRWFVDFEFPNEDEEPYKSSGGEMVDSELGMIPKGWNVGGLGDIANIVMGQSPKGSTYNEEGVGEVFFQGRAEFGVRFPKRRLYTSEPKRMAYKGDILMSVRAPVGDLNIAHEKCCIGRGLSAIQSKYGYNSFILYTMFNLEKQLNVFNGEGTVFGSINKDALNNLKVIIPSSDVIESFEAIVSKMDGIIEKNYDEVCSLQELRDILLPKLMLGEIRIK
ncbi:MAG: restriction endonuclease subunit S [Cellulosilyticaceae bacterium]